MDPSYQVYQGALSKKAWSTHPLGDYFEELLAGDLINYRLKKNAPPCLEGLVDERLPFSPMMNEMGNFRKMF